LNPKTLLENRFGVVVVTGVVDANGVYNLRGGEPLTENRIHIKGYTRNFVVSEQVASDVSILGHEMTLYAIYGNDVNRIVGTPTPRQQEISTTLDSYQQMKIVMEHSPIEVTGNTQYFINYVSTDASIMDTLGDNVSITIVDHEGDGAVDIVFVDVKEIVDEEEVETEEEDDDDGE